LPLGFTADTLPNQDYLLKLLSTLNPEHEIFGKGYVKPVVSHQPEFIDDSKGFFQNLPPPKRTKKHK